MSVKDKVLEFVKKIGNTLKTHSLITSIVGFSVVSLILVQVAILALEEFVVSDCV